MNKLLDTIAPLLQLVAPQPCFDKYTKDYDFFDVPCMKIVISKCLGYAIILGAVLVKVPQILKIWNAGSGKGISLLSVTLELIAVTSSFVYGFQKSFPFSAYGEGFFLVVQTLIIGLLVLHYSRQHTVLFCYVSIYMAALAYLMSPAASMNLVQFLQAAVMPNLLAGRSIQIYTNYTSGSTGQLSVVTCFLLFAGAVVRVFTSIQETGDMLLVMTYVVSATCNGVILFQIWFYSGSKKHEKEKKEL